jgi:hypothetical protein
MFPTDDGDFNVDSAGASLVMKNWASASYGEGPSAMRGVGFTARTTITVSGHLYARQRERGPGHAAGHGSVASS